MLNKWDSFFLIFMTLPIMGHVVVLPLLLDVAGRDAWISVMLSLPLSLLLAWGIFTVRKKYANQSFPDWIIQLIGKPIGLLFLMLLAVYLLFLSAFSLASLVDMVKIGFLPESPIWGLAVWFMLFCVIAAYRGVKAIALTAAILTFIALITGHSITLLATPMKELNYITPILQFGWIPSFWGSVILISIWVELMFLLLIPIENINEKRLYLFWVIAIAFNALMMLSTFTGSVMIFGLGQADNFTYPALETVRVISLGFIDRFDVYGLILMVVGCYIRISLYYRLTYELFVPRLVSGKWITKFLFWGFGIMILVGGILLSHTHIRIQHTTVFYTYTVVLFPLPFLLWVISSIQEKKEKRRKTPSV